MSLSTQADTAQAGTQADTPAHTHRASGLGPHALSQRVPCSICGVGIDTPCIDDDGQTRDHPHNSRWIRYQRLLRQRPFTAVVRRSDDPRLGVGEVILCATAPDGRTLQILNDGTERRDLPATIAQRDIEFRAFVDEGAMRTTRGATGAAARRAGHQARLHTPR